jgi:hypothetical protein
MAAPTAIAEKSSHRNAFGDGSGNGNGKGERRKPLRTAEWARPIEHVPITIHPTESLLEAAFRDGMRYRRPICDCLYLVLAAVLGARVVTADRRLYNGVRGGPLDHLVLWITDARRP